MVPSLHTHERLAKLSVELGLNTHRPLSPLAGWPSEARPALVRSCVPHIPRQAPLQSPHCHSRSQYRFPCTDHGGHMRHN